MVNVLSLKDVRLGSKAALLIDSSLMSAFERIADIVGSTYRYVGRCDLDATSRNVLI